MKKIEELGEIFLTEEQIKEKIIETAKIIDGWYDGNPILLVGILKSASFFMADLCRAITIPCEIEYMTVKNFFHGRPGVEITRDIEKKDLNKYNVIVIEDLIETGQTIIEIKKVLKKRHPKSLKVITLLDKPYKHINNFQADLSLFIVPDKCFIGYGMDYVEYYRNYPNIIDYEINK